MRKLFTILSLTLLFAAYANAQKDLTILLVHDDDQTTSTTEAIQSAVTDAGYAYVDHNAIANGVPNSEGLEAYELIIWCAGKDYTGFNFFDKSNAENVKPYADMLSYLDAGGMLWISGLNVLSDAGGSAPQTFADGDFVYNYLGIESYAVQANLYSMLVSADNGICTVNDVAWTWSYDYMGFVDHAIPTSTAKSIYTSSTRADTSVMVYNEKGDAKILSDFIRWDAFVSDNDAVRTEIVGEILGHFNQFHEAAIDAASVEITADSYAIAQNNGTLQLTATVLPEDATNKTVVWSIEDGSVLASITQTGLLTASGLDTENGTVTVKVTANGADDLSVTKDITISNQALGEGYKVLLVNDNNYTTRYLDIDTALVASAYIYKTFDTAKDGVAPSLDYLNNFDFVLWYAGNDQKDLHFWDVSDSTDIKCNANLKDYADDGGVVWVQGLDVFYDVWGDKFTAKNELDSIITTFDTGDFVYDYLGIKELVTETKIHGVDAAPPYDGVPQLDITEENTIMDMALIEWEYTTMWNADAFDVTDNAMPLYYMGPETYAFSLYYGMVYNINANAHFVTSTFETARLDTQDNINMLVKQVLDYFESISTGISHTADNSFELSVYPNPANNVLNVKFSAHTNSSTVISIIDITGKQLIKQQVSSTVGTQEVSINTSALSKGIYNVSVSSANGVSNQMIIIE